MDTQRELFRGHEYKMTTKIFAGPNTLEDSNAPWTDVVQEDFHVVVYKDKYPVNPGHLLFVPKYNTIDVLADAWNDAMQYGLKIVKSGECDGFNIGLNYGKAAGQTVGWPHIHVIPRFDGDVKDPVGGIRNVIPGNGNYRK